MPYVLFHDYFPKIAEKETRTVIVVLLAVNGSAGTEKFGPVDTVVPAHSSAVADLTTLATLLAALVGSTTTVESSAPPKPVSV